MRLFRSPVQSWRLVRAEMAFARGDDEAAVEWARRAVRKHPDDPAAQLDLARFLYQQYRDSGASLGAVAAEVEGHVQQAVASRVNASLLTMAAHVMYLLFEADAVDYTVARGYAQRAADAARGQTGFPFRTTLSRLLGRFAEHEARWEDAETWYRRAVAGQAAARRRRDERIRAMTAVNFASTYFLGETSPTVVVDHVRLLTRADRHAEALQVARQGVADNPGSEELRALHERCEKAANGSAATSTDPT
jgi:tetratricopeptide (TPR) repeat protein